FFTGYSGELADAVREGRRKEFAKFAAFNDEARREEIPDPNAESTFERSRPRFVPADAVAQATQAPTDDDGKAWLAFYRDALAIRHRHVIPGLHGGAQPLGAEVFAAPDADPRDGAVIARWRMSTGAILTIAVNLSASDVDARAVTAAPIYQVPAQAAATLAAGRIAAHSCVVTLEAPNGSAARTTQPEEQTR
ncbi:MAG: DUF3459 domain-containing protein, partial [Janthinobacterium lividum]